MALLLTERIVGGGIGGLLLYATVEKLSSNEQAVATGNFVGQIVGADSGSVFVSTLFAGAIMYQCACALALCVFSRSLIAWLAALVMFGVYTAAMGIGLQAGVASSSCGCGLPKAISGSFQFGIWRNVVLMILCAGGAALSWHFVHCNVNVDTGFRFNRGLVPR